jgi:hypothetical protein
MLTTANGCDWTTYQACHVSVYIACGASMERRIALAYSFLIQIGQTNMRWKGLCTTKTLMLIFVTATVLSPCWLRADVNGPKSHLVVFLGDSNQRPKFNNNRATDGRQNDMSESALPLSSDEAPNKSP